MATVSTIVELFGVSKHTVRTWSSEFARYLSAGASPTPGQKRVYDDQDLGVFALVAHLRQQNASYDEIHDALASGQRFDFGPQSAGTAAIGGPARALMPAPSSDFAPVEVFQLFAEKLTQQYQSQIQELRSEIDRVGRERDYFRGQVEGLYQELKEERDRILVAEKTISRQESELAAAANQAQLLHEERTARINAVNKLAAAQAKAEKLEQMVDSGQLQDKGGRGLFPRR